MLGVGAWLRGRVVVSDNAGCWEGGGGECDNCVCGGVGG